MKSLKCPKCDVELINVHSLIENNTITEMQIYCPYCLDSFVHKIRGKFAFSNNDDHYYELKDDNNLYVIQL